MRSLLPALLLCAALRTTALPATTVSNTIVSCFLPDYIPPTQDKIMHGLFYLNGVKGHGDPLPPPRIRGIPGKTRMISCSGKTAFYLSVNADQSRDIIHEYAPSELGFALDDGFHFCYGGPPSDKEKPIPAYQIFGKNYVVTVAGQANCDYRDIFLNSEKEFRLGSRS